MRAGSPRQKKKDVTGKQAGRAKTAKYTWPCRVLQFTLERGNAARKNSRSEVSARPSKKPVFFTRYAELLMTLQKRKDRVLRERKWQYFRSAASCQE
jgi:hypothetical protein